MILRNWGLGRLVASWVVLLAVALAPLAREYWEIRRTDGHGTIDFTWSGGALQAIAHHRAAPADDAPLDRRAAAAPLGPADSAA